MPVPALFTQSTRDKVAQKTKDSCIPSTGEARSQEKIHGLPATRGHCGAESEACRALQLPPKPALKVFEFMETEPWRKQQNSEKQNQPTSFTTPRFYRPPEATFLHALKQCDLATHQTDDHSIHLSLFYNQAHCRPPPEVEHRNHESNLGAILTLGLALPWAHGCLIPSEIILSGSGAGISIEELAKGHQ